MRANIQGVSLKIQTLKSNDAMAQAMKGVTKAMTTMNKQMKLPQIQQIMREFEKQSEIMDMKEEMMNDAVDDAMGDEDDEEESNAIVTQVLDELGLQLGDQLSGEVAYSMRRDNIIYDIFILTFNHCRSANTQGQHLYCCKQTAHSCGFS